MSFKSLFIFALVALHYSVPSLAAPGPLQARAGVCSSGIYGQLAPILQPYPIAQAFCTAYFPVKCTSAAAMVKRATTTSSKSSSSTSTKATITSATTVTTSKTTSSVDPKVSAWSQIQAQGASVVSTMCSCIESAKPCTSKTSSSSSSTTTPPAPAPTCSGASITSSTSYTYCLFYKGNGVSASFDWGVQETFTANSDIDALQHCADVAVGGADSFRVYYSNSLGEYVCQLGNGPACDSNFQPNSDVAQMYVYEAVGTTC